MKSLIKNMLFAFLSVTVLFSSSAVLAAADAFHTARPEDVPAWAGQSAFQFIRIDGGRIESLKAERTWWGRDFSAEEKDVLSHAYDSHADKIISLLREAGFNWVWVTWSNGWSFDEEAENRKLIRDFIARCHKEGIKVTTYLSATNIFWESTFKDEPESVTWLLINGGKPVNYGGPDNPMRFLADINNPDWRKYMLKKTRLAVKAGADAVFFDNILGDRTGVQQFFTQVQAMLEKTAREDGIPKPLLYGNAHIKVDSLPIHDRCEIVWDEYGKSDPGVWEEGWYVENARKTLFLSGAKFSWQPQKYEMDKYHCGPREKCFPGPAGQKLSIAEAWAFGSSLSRNIEGRFLHDLIKDVPAAKDAWAAVSLYNNFINSHRDLYTGVAPAASIALLSQTGRSGPAGQLGEDRLMEMFIKENVPFAVKLAGRLDRGLPLSHFKTLLVPGPLSALSPDEKSTLREFARAGGRILPLVNNSDTPEPAAADSDMLDAVQPVLISPEAVSTVARSRPAPEIIAAANDASGGPIVTLENETYVVTSIMKKENSGRLIVHLLNYDLEKPEKDVKVTLDISDYAGPAGKCSVKLLSPDSGTPAAGNVASENGKCSFTVDEIKHYTVAVVDVK